MSFFAAPTGPASTSRAYGQAAADVSPALAPRASLWSSSHTRHVPHTKENRMNTTRGPALDGTPSTRRPRLPSPSLVLATAALFVALTGAATAAGIVAYAKRAGTADNAKHLGGKTAAQIAATVHGPAGPQGPAGAVGPGGPKGDQGAAGAGGAAGAEGPQGGVRGGGARGDVGAVGAGVKIVGTVATQADLPTTGTTGDAYLVGGNAYVWTGSAWTNAGPVQGPKDDKGDTGPTGPAGPQGIQGVAGTAAVSVHQQDYTLDADAEKVVTGNCDTGQLAVNGGWDSAKGTVVSFDSKPTVGDHGWQIDLLNFDANNPASGSVYVICLG